MLRGFLTALAIYGGIVEDCTSPGALSHVVDMGISPVTPNAGDTSFLWVDFDLSQNVYGGNVTYSYTWNYIPFEPTIVDLCSQTQCPLYAGVQNVTGNSTFPDASGLLEVTVNWADEYGDQIWCVKTTYNLQQAIVKPKHL